MSVDTQSAPQPEPTSQDNAHSDTESQTSTSDSATADDDNETEQEFVPPAGPHTLSRKYTLYYTPPLQHSSKALGSDAWQNLLKSVTTISSVEEYWQLFNNIKSATQLTEGASYHLFASNVKPEWEDAANKDGGRWQFSVRKQQGNTDNKVDEMWVLLTMALIGAWCTDASHINGVVLSHRAKEIRFQAWTREYTNEEVQMRIGRELKQHLNNISERMEYQGHFSKSRSSEYTL